MCETEGMEVNEMDWQVVEKMRGKEDFMETMKGNNEVEMKKDGVEKNEKEGFREDQTSTPMANQEVTEKEGTPSGVALSNHRFDPFPISPSSLLKQESSALPSISDLMKVCFDPLVDCLLVSFCCCPCIKVLQNVFQITTIMMTFMVKI